MEIVQRQSLSEMVAGRIKQMIMADALKPGDRLPTEQELSQRFGVSRVSVREATKALSFLGIIRSAPRRGLTVGEVNMRRVTEYLGFHLALNDFPRDQLLDTRIVIETGALRHVMERMAADPTLYERLSRVADELKVATTGEQRIAADIAFHRALLEASGIEPLVAFNDLLQIFFNRFRHSILDGAWPIGIEQHQKMLEALAAGKLNEAAEILSTHINYHRERM